MSASDIDAAFRFLDASGKGKITIGALRQKLSAFFPGKSIRCAVKRVSHVTRCLLIADMPLSELKFLLGDKKEITPGELHDLLDGNQITNFDPVAEAFRCFDPAATGYADVAHTREIFARLGLDLSDDDVRVLISTADADHDGAISLLDFREMLQRAAPKGDAGAGGASGVGGEGGTGKS